MVCFQFTDSLSEVKREMELHLSSLHLLADVASLVSQGKLSLASSIPDPDDEKKVTTFRPTWVGWIGKKKRSPRVRRLTFRTQTLNSDPVVVQNENLRGVAENRKKRPRAFNSTETQESNWVSKKIKKTGLAAPIRQSELPINYMVKIRGMQGRDVTLVVEKALTATDMSRGQSRLSIPKKQIRKAFLSEEEIRILERKEGIKVSLIQPCLEVSHGLRLKKWNYSSKNFSYMLTEKWNAIAHPYELNKLKKDVLIQLWSFRVDDDLWFCLTKASEEAESIAPHELSRSIS